MSKGQVYRTKDVFTPSKPARATFVEREDINDKLVSALRTPGKQIVVYGHSGSGKTTLLINKLHQLYENHVTTRCINGVTFDQLILDAFDQLNVYYESENTKGKKYGINSSLSAEYLGIKSQIGTSISTEEGKKHQRVIPIQLTIQNLARFMGEAKCCWVLEDFHKISINEKVRFSQTMKLFMDMSDTYEEVRVVAIGAVDTARQVVEYDSDMRNRVAEINVPLMKEGELLQVIRVKNNIVKFSNGLASACHQICLNICFAAGIDETLTIHETIGDDILEKALDMYVDNASDTLKGAFEKAFYQTHKKKFDNAKMILRALINFDQDGAVRSDIFAAIKKQLNSSFEEATNGCKRLFNKI
jgi:energy-coupling factor transporter ATP-binding protein EcfA2